MREVGRFYGKLLERSVEVNVTAEPMLLDVQTPVGMFEHLQDISSALLESADPSSNFSRYSFLCGKPLLEFTFKDGILEVNFSNKRHFKVKTEDPIAHLSDACLFEKEINIDEQGFFGGFVGYISFDAFRYFEPTSASVLHESEYPISYFQIPEYVICFDHKTNLAKIFCTELRYEGTLLNQINSRELIKEIKKRLFSSGFSYNEAPLASESIGRTSSTFAYEDFLRAVVKAKEYIFEGDAYQIVLSQRFTYPNLISPFRLYRYLRISNPSPYMYYFPTPYLTLVGASPEPMLKVESRKALTRPIAGTRKRGRTIEEDMNLEKEMLSDEKEICEHTMLVDLARNDFYRICETDSVFLTKKFTVEKYSHVMHLVSEVIGDLKEGKTSVDALKSVFPAGTVVGAPKIRAAQIISELEPCSRGPYAGAFGYLNFNGDLDTCILIRTAVIDRKGIHIQAGAGIVRDSVPINEYEETLNKAKGILEVLEKGVYKHASFGG
ncbi:MAG: anthranilate synthase component I family protein [Actinobacteria bacterium]|nr:anthranilate synthase component I family protein [Actinomycetota bacterium]